MAVKVLSQYERLRPAYLSIEQLWRHSMDVAQTAKQLVVLATRDRGLAASAFTAGLLHDLGKVVLAANFDEHYSGAHSLARKLQVPLWEIEREVFGASHGEIGAYLFGLWGMPPELLEAVALHHNPSRTTSDEFSPLTAVHVANALECEVSPEAEGLVVPEVDEAYLAGIGCLDRLEVWRAAVASHDFTNAELRVRLPESVPAKPAPTAPEPVPAPPPAGPAPESQPEASAPVPEPVAPVPAPEPYLPPPERAGPFRRRRWLYAGAAAALLLLVVDWLATGLGTGQPQPIRARTVAKASRPAPGRSLAREKAPTRKPSRLAPAPSVAKAQTRTPASTPAQAAPAPSVGAAPSPPPIFARCSFKIALRDSRMRLPSTASTFTST